jgi:Fe2+ or Zn2+ uptake regulation protein
VSDKLTVHEVYSRYMVVLRVIKDYETQNPPCLPLYSDLQEKTKLCNSTFCRALNLLEDGKFIKKFEIDGKSYYSLRKWGEMMLELDEKHDYWAWLIALQAVYNIDGPRVVLNG